jgi:hypothetical protein
MESTEFYPTDRSGLRVSLSPGRWVHEHVVTNPQVEARYSALLRHVGHQANRRLRASVQRWYGLVRGKYDKAAAALHRRNALARRGMRNWLEFTDARANLWVSV